MNYEKYINEKQTSQSRPIPGSTQVANSAGGFSWEVDDWKRLERFLILGSEGGSYYATEKALTVTNAEALRRCIKADGLRVVGAIVDVSLTGRAPKNDPAIFALAMCAKLGDDRTRAAAYGALSSVCRIGTHIFHFVKYAEAVGGWGRGMRRAVARWYDSKPVADLAYQLVKYQGRDGWTNRDLLRLSKPRKAEGTRDTLYHWATRGEEAVIERWLSNGGEPGASPLDCPDLQLVHAFEMAKEAKHVAETVELVTRYRLPRECVRTEHLNAPEVWAALLPHMKPEALVRNLGKMTSVGLIAPMSRGEAEIVKALSDGEYLRRARLHPIKVLSALLTYKSGRGIKGSLTWAPSARVVDALDRAFYETFGAVTPSGARIMLALDISGSMDGGTVAGVPGLTPRVASAAMALITAATEARHCFGAFTATFSDLTISPRQRLDDVVRQMQRLQMGGTDCAQPMLHALRRKLEVDTFVIYTDSETWAGGVHPAQALREYRQKMGINAKLVVVGLIANQFTIADPNDAGMLDVVGFDTAAPQVISDFSRAQEVR